MLGSDLGMYKEMFKWSKMQTSDLGGVFSLGRSSGRPPAVREKPLEWMKSPRRQKREKRKRGPRTW